MYSYALLFHFEEKKIIIISFSFFLFLEEKLLIFKNIQVFPSCRGPIASAKPLVLDDSTNNQSCKNVSAVDLHHIKRHLYVKILQFGNLNSWPRHRL